MRSIAAIGVLAVAGLCASVAIASPSPAAKDALVAGDWRSAAALGASAADVVRALLEKGRIRDAVPEQSVVTINPDNSVEVVALRPLPDLDRAIVGPNARTAKLHGTGFTFTAKRGSIILYPAYATGSFAAN